MKSTSRKSDQEDFRARDSASSERLPSPGLRPTPRHLTNLYGIIGLLAIVAATLGMFAFWPEDAERRPVGSISTDFVEGKPLEQIHPLVTSVSANVDIVDTEGHPVDASVSHYTVVSITHEDNHRPKIIVTREPWEAQNSLGELLMLYERSVHTSIIVIDNTTQEILPQDVRGYTVVREEQVSDHRTENGRKIYFFVERIHE
ncbi:hypothetical protein [Pseudoclavibacter sp. RFBG4]|uniref:hypothetical protein n=1 Tax=Pseudoclavibacter sp. RFBG4 TaxID=2080575 RepID=UPI0011B03080|nr:hypothetical protein [Pseudoclavibacter sp. RFBG4]